MKKRTFVGMLAAGALLVGGQNIAAQEQDTRPHRQNRTASWENGEQYGHCDFAAIERDGIDMEAEMNKIMREAREAEEGGHCDFEAMERDGIDMAAELDKIMREANEKASPF
jgi:hypothetical protein